MRSSRKSLLLTLLMLLGFAFAPLTVVYAADDETTEGEHSEAVGDDHGAEDTDTEAVAMSVTSAESSDAGTWLTLGLLSLIILLIAIVAIIGAVALGVIGIGYAQVSGGDD